MVAALVFILLGILIKYRKMYSNSWLYVCQKKTEKQDIMETGFRNANV
jgi:hypothetical protein